MRQDLSLLAATCLIATFAAPAGAETAPDGNVCAAGPHSTFSPEQRIAACTAVISATKDQPLERAHALRERASAQRGAGRGDRALLDANEAIRLDPSDAKAYDYRANAFVDIRQFDRAIEDYNEALRLDPKYAQAWSDRGATYYFMKDYDRAIENFNEAVRFDPTNARAFTNHGAALKKVGQNDRALADESEAIRLDPTVPEYFDNRGLSYASNGDYDRAIVDYDQAIRIAPKANFLTNRGNSYNQKGDLDRAIADYDRAVKLNPSFYLAYNNRGIAYRKKGDLDHAIADFEQVVRIAPQINSAVTALARVRQERDRLDLVSDRLLPTFDCRDARKAAEKAICSDPDLSRLDRQIDDAYKTALARLDRKEVAGLRQEQRAFLGTRNTAFGRPDYNLKREMERRLTELRGLVARN